MPARRAGPDENARCSCRRLAATDRRLHNGCVRVVEPSEHDEAAASAAGIEPMTVPEILGADGNSGKAVHIRTNSLVGDGAMSMPRLQAFMPDAFQRDIPISRVG